MHTFRSVLLLGIVTVLMPARVAGQQFGGDLTVEQASSSITAGGSALSTPVTAQGTGSLTTSYTGTFGIGTLDLSNMQLSFSAATNLLAANSGNWQPLSGGGAGSEAANYGGVIDLGGLGGVRFAIRDLTATVSTLTPITLTPEGGGVYSFPTNQEVTLLTPSVLDYEGFGLAGGSVGSGSTSLNTVNAINSAGNGTITDLGGGNFSIVYPVSLTFVEEFGGQDATITLNGSITAQGTLVPVPEPGLILGVSALVLGGVWRRRSGRQPACPRA